MRLLLIGDIVGKPGRQIVARAVPHLIRIHGIDLVVANGENAAGGSGLTPANYAELIAAGVDCVTLGDHIYRRNEIIPVLEQRDQHRQAGQFPGHRAGPRICRSCPLATAPACAIVSLLGRVFMRPSIAPGPRSIGCWPPLPPDVQIILVDFHAEATSDKQLDGPLSRRPGRARSWALTRMCRPPTNRFFLRAPHFNATSA